MPIDNIPQNIPHGRTIIRTDLDASATVDQLKEDLARVLPMHAKNRDDIRSLQEYFKGYHPAVQEREKTTRTDVDNKITVNHARAFTRDITGYFIGTPVQYTHREGKWRKQMENLNAALEMENKSLVDNQIGEDGSICGLGFRGTFSEANPTNGTHLKLMRLEPQDTFVVYSSNPIKPPVYAVSFYDAGTKAQPKRFYNLYTPKKLYVFEDDTVGENDPMTGAKLTLKSESDIYVGGGLPITEYPNNQWRMGDWETEIALMDAADFLASDGVNDIQQAVNAILVAMGVEMSADDFANISTNGFLNVANIPQGLKPFIDFISQPMSADIGIAMRDYVESTLRGIVGVPDRKSRPGGGGDTGDAVFMRDGWQDIDLVVSMKEPYFRQAEREAIQVMLYILKTNKEVANIKPSDIEIHFNRNRTANAQSKAQTYSTLTSGDAPLAPVDALAIANLTNNVPDVILRAESYQANMREMRIKDEALKVQNAAKNSDEGDAAKKQGTSGGTAKAGSRSDTRQE